MTFTLDFYSDCGHGWLAVPKAIYKLSKFTSSRYSYYDKAKEIVYLEEDCDAPEFIIAMNILGYKIEHTWHDIDGDSPIRKLSRMPGY